MEIKWLGVWRGWIWGLLGNDTGFFCFLWCLVVTDICYTSPRLTLAAKATSQGQLLQWSDFLEGVLGLHPSHILVCPLLAPLVGQKETSEHTQALPLPSQSCSYPNHHSEWSSNLTDRCVQGVRWCREAQKAQTCFPGPRGAGGRSVFVMVLNLSSLGRDSSQDLHGTKRMWGAGMGSQQKVPSYLAEFFSWVTFWGVINPWVCMHRWVLLSRLCFVISVPGSLIYVQVKHFFS